MSTSLVSGHLFAYSSRSLDKAATPCVCEGRYGSNQAGYSRAWVEVWIVRFWMLNAIWPIMPGPAGSLLARATMIWTPEQAREFTSVVNIRSKANKATKRLILNMLNGMYSILVGLWYRETLVNTKKSIQVQVCSLTLDIVLKRKIREWDRNQRNVMPKQCDE